MRKQGIPEIEQELEPQFLPNQPIAEEEKSQKLNQKTIYSKVWTNGLKPLEVEDKADESSGSENDLLESLKQIDLLLLSLGTRRKSGRTRKMIYRSLNKRPTLEMPEEKPQAPEPQNAILDSLNDEKLDALEREEKALSKNTNKNYKMRQLAKQRAEIERLNKRLEAIGFDKEFRNPERRSPPERQNWPYR